MRRNDYGRTRAIPGYSSGFSKIRANISSNTSRNTWLLLGFTQVVILNMPTVGIRYGKGSVINFESTCVQIMSPFQCQYSKLVIDPVLFVLISVGRSMSLKLEKKEKYWLERGGSLSECILERKRRAIYLDIKEIGISYSGKLKSM